ncbi:bifunctional diaminohydroxyphosphoribosylaminopyrimidine deaminase/5-amino-6-(5-phosphoribosylamino)uracil reductase RibD [Flavivirga abyssicola]|uniref:bifunctional diaminohydroxyphosphoribosylaminopyrimidine deaminase/5-amino-6-(5-phosphoribosylamino)uracil reductase RibD n=1 Tax=Flavivirga abyssicola TaxID=3063533 RepID=UPI0026DEA390|nr:bifunctional diaminohydroxyphosphoribosylaminopyrimidine deaminase/5-amino-6-(5-phosphoribosylamino)uracil reductase RibD [Flavivirga sp. MEBiC07777]WVK13419.1 bifunctional diaminohydroxyphosphoribosylaminopyrimidine deaminase/5-amino-6-(5-phosphoribosylamino)uracil reductase RibD [Flavivirga sp. MEBiC07777]
MTNNETYIKRCIEIAKNGLGYTRPNPMVGSVIVYDNQIIGEGYTSPYGGNHAEVNAINSVTDKALLKNATIYVTLEPCSHYGKTPPCSDLIIKHKIPNVVIGCIDDNTKVAGKGIKKLIEAHCNVTVGVLETACKEHHNRFFTFHNKKRPYIILKWAETKDGFIAPKNREEQKPVWITNKYSRQLVHKWRAEEQAILVGTNTVLQDNPSLTTRDWKGNHPIRIVLDKDLKLSKEFSVFNNDAKTITINNIDFSKNIAQQICDILHHNDITSVIIEGGQKTLQTFIDEGIWDEARVFTGDTEFKKGVKAPIFSGKLISEEKIMSDILKVYNND